MDPRLITDDPAPKYGWRRRGLSPERDVATVLGDDGREELVGVFDLGDGWACRLTLEAFDDVLGISGVELRPAVDLLGGVDELPSRPISSAQLKALRTRTMVAQLRDHLLAHDGIRATFAAEHSAIPLDTLRQAARSVGPRGGHDRDYALLAARYIDLVDQGSARPNADLADDLGACWDAARVRDWLHRARRRGLLTPTRRGQAGGELTPKARALLDQED